MKKIPSENSVSADESQPRPLKVRKRKHRPRVINDKSFVTITNIITAAPEVVLDKPHTTTKEQLNNTLDVLKKSSRKKNLSMQKRKEKFQNAAFKTTGNNPRKNSGKYHAGNAWGKLDSSGEKTGVLVNRNYMPENVNQEKFQTYYQAKSKEIPNRRPIESVHASPGGTTKVAFTPGKTPLYPRRDLGIMEIYSETQLPIFPTKDELPEGSTFFSTPEYNNIIEGPDDGIQYHNAKITQSDLNQVKNEKKFGVTRNQDREVVKEKVAIHKGRAHTYAEVSGLFDDILHLDAALPKQLFPKKHWGHGIPHQAKGSASQHHSNLNIETEATNNEKLIVEQMIPYLIKRHKFITWETFTHTIEKTKIGTYMHLNVSIANLVTIPLTFNLQDPKGPMLVNKKDIKILFKGVLKSLDTKENILQVSNKYPIVSNNQQGMFYYDGKHPLGKQLQSDKENLTPKKVKK